MLVSGITTLLHLLTCWLLVFKSSMGFLGAALSIVISYWTNFLLLAAYIKFSPSCAKSWTGFSKEAFHKIWEFLKLIINSFSYYVLSGDVGIRNDGFGGWPSSKSNAGSICSLNLPQHLWNAFYDTYGT